MSDIVHLHNKAMDLAESAVMAKLQGNVQKYQELSRRALELEKEAALKSPMDLEPTRSVLFRSAATLAIDCEEYREAEKLISLALAGEPPSEIAEELRDLLEEVYFSRHLEARGITLERGEFQLSLTGNAVGFGVTQSEAFIDRARKIEKLIYRTAERMLGKPFRKAGNVSKDLQKNFQVFLSVPRAASFAISFKVGQNDQMELFPEKKSAFGVIEELVSCFELFNDNKEDELKKHISDEAYFTNFLALAKQISPDGDDITQVGFTSIDDQGTSKIAIRRTGKKQRATQNTNNNLIQESNVTLIGTLKYADSTGSNDIIKLVEKDTYKQITVVVPEGMMSDIVKPLWDDLVQVEGHFKNKRLMLEDITKFKEES